jgi:hypothetical protein
VSTGGVATFLWGGGAPRPNPDTFAPRTSHWWDQYRGTLNLSPPAIREIAESSRRLVGLLPDPLNWNDSPSPFKGLVVGAVQSGKTASMIGVAAVALDHGYRIVVVLAGTKDDLREQTARRFNTQLLRQSDAIPGSAATTMGTAKGKGPLGGFALPYTIDANKYSHLQLRIEQALQSEEPCVLVVKKNATTLRDLREVLHWTYARYGADNVPTLILDDECDDASGYP